MRCALNPNLCLFALLALATAPPQIIAGAATHPGTPCEKLTGLAIPNVTIESARFQPAGPLSNNSAIRTPDTCRVHAIARPVADSEIRIEVWLPIASAWNGKFLGTGNGGYSSALSYPQMASALNQGYATAGHDTGHTGADPRFGFGHPEKVHDYAWRAVHLMTTTAKRIVRIHFGRHAAQSYFSGCSAGGHQALSELQRFPEDYDGIIAGAPANNRIRQTFGFVWSWMALHDPATGAPLVTPDQLRMVSAAAVQHCDPADGLRDGLIADPRRCSFDPAHLACTTSNPPDRPCLTPVQIEAFRKVYAGLRHPRTGERIFAGFSKGSESLGGENPTLSWRMYLLDPKEPMRAEVLRYFLFHDLNWDWRTVDFDRDLAFADQELGFMNATARDISPFANRGGKLILYAGWSDPIVPPEDTVLYYEAVAAAMRGIPRTQQFARLFVAPGMAHCAGGPGPNRFDALAALDRWVTKNEPPRQILATHESNGVVDRSRPLCPYPQVARYKGAGSIDRAENFTCSTPATGASVRVRGSK